MRTSAVGKGKTLEPSWEEKGMKLKRLYWPLGKGRALLCPWSEVRSGLTWTRVHGGGRMDGESSPGSA